MGTSKMGQRDAQGVEVPQAWIWSHYRGVLPQGESKRGQAYDPPDPMLYEEKSAHPFATALGLAISVGIIVGLVWLFMPATPSGAPGGSARDRQSLETLPPSSEANAANEAEASHFRNQKAVIIESPPPPIRGVENKLRSFLEHGPGKEAAFDLDQVAFGMGTAILTPASREDLQRLAQVLREYPKTHVAIGVHSDVGDSSAQIARLSAERARNVRSELIHQGIRSSSLSVIGERATSVSTSTVARPGCVWIDVWKK
jgi:outer membrane protein OmpA-like peptidoglycan-associated protein